MKYIIYILYIYNIERTHGWVRRFLKWGFCRCVMKDIDLQEVQHVYVGVWSSDRRDGMGGWVD